MSILTSIEQSSAKLKAWRHSPEAARFDAPIETTNLHRQATVGTLHLYRADLAPSATLLDDVPVTIVLPEGMEPTEGLVLAQEGSQALIQIVDDLGAQQASATIVPDATAFVDAAAQRLSEIVAKSSAFTLGPAERLTGLLEGDPAQAAQTMKAAGTSVLTTVWADNLAERRSRLATLLVELVRANKRVLLISPDHRMSDDLTASLAKNLKAAGLTYKTYLTRYEVAVERERLGIPLTELGFEAQMHQFFAKSRADKAALRRKYERFRELTPILAYKAQKQQELDEVRLLEWRLMTQLTECRTKIAEIDQIVAQYEALPIWKRLAMQSVGKNVETLAEYRQIYEQQTIGLKKELDIAKARIDELAPEAAVPRDMRPEYDELKEEVVRLGGTKKIRELLAAEEGTNRQAFVQNKRIVATTAGRVLSDSLFARVRFDVLVVDEAPHIPASFVLGAAAITRERIVLSGDLRDFALTGAWDLSREVPLVRSDRSSNAAVGR
ncbi:MAG TPA: AAA domain-containing protein [Nitrospiraceae bacterium]|nr:AAA domain-containing protein [Nitrospiraceae bacterium]